MRLFMLVALLAATVSGCGQPSSRLHGTVKYQGKPVTGGTVIFLTQDNMTYVADLRADGTYEVTGIPRGHVRVSIQQPPPRPAPRSQVAPKGGWKDVPADVAADDKGKMARRPEGATPPGQTPAGPRIPARYADPDQSGLSFELTEPDQEFSVDLK